VKGIGSGIKNVAKYSDTMPPGRYFFFGHFCFKLFTQCQQLAKTIKIKT